MQLNQRLIGRHEAPGISGSSAIGAAVVESMAERDEGSPPFPAGFEPAPHDTFDPRQNATVRPKAMSVGSRLHGFALIAVVFLLRLEPGEADVMLGAVEHVVSQGMAGTVKRLTFRPGSPSSSRRQAAL